MGENNKILDVAYGRFSCRLEGFDDSVETMKSVVGYFHDLAGDNLFADDTPVVPDLDDLERLAAEQTDGAVAIESDAHGISLRVMSKDIPAEDTDDETASDLTEAPADADDGDIGEDEHQTFEENTPPKATNHDTDEDSAADRLQRIRAVVASGTPPERAETYSEDLGETYSEDLTENEIPQDKPKPLNPLAQRLAELAKRNSELMEADAESEAPLAPEDTPLVLSEEELVDDAGEEQEYDEAGGTAQAVAEDYPDDEAEIDAQDDVLEERDMEPLILTTPQQPVTPADDEDIDDDDDFDLHEEVAKIEREIAARPGNEVARHGLPRSVEDAMSRILTKTDLQLDLQETRDGRDAIAQLKAAVAATEAARQLGDTDTKSQDVSAKFRDDLGALEGTERPEGETLPPLRLVEPVNLSQSNLRVVPPMTEAAARLREIAATTKANAADTGTLTFAEFARQQGVTDLVDTLEAAGAYLAFVEGESDFSRPQVMKVVQSASDTEVTREDGLRSFGLLLRQSRIIKLNNGRFKVAENTRFRPSDDQAAHS